MEFYACLRRERNDFLVPSGAKFLCSFAKSDGKIPLVPAMYIFGDSIVDGGNNKVEPPYGIDLDPLLPPRATNGLTVADYIAMSLGLPLIPPFRNGSAESRNSKIGINYAYGGSTMLPETMQPHAWNFDEQINAFRSTIYDRLTKDFGSDEYINHMGKSIYLISFAINDYVSYFNENNGKASPNIKPIVFSKYLLRSLSERLTRLYRMGARKFMVKNIWPMDCMPIYNSNGLICDQTINNVVTQYSNSMPVMLQDLAADLDGFTYSYSDEFSFLQYLKFNTQLTGITKILEKCWDIENKRLCKNRDTYLYFDNIHPTQAANREFALNCFKGIICAPQNIMGLVEVGA